jgi:hypothetical protein
MRRRIIAGVTSQIGPKTLITRPYLVATQDHAIPPKTQRFMAARAHATIAQVKASHVPMISQPGATTKLILKAAKAVS